MIRKRERLVKKVLVHAGHAFSPLMQHLDELRVLNQEWSQIAPLFSAHAKIARFEEGLMVLIVNNAHWATQIRYHIPDLIEACQKTSTFQTLQKIELKISVNE